MTSSIFNRLLGRSEIHTIVPRRSLSQETFRPNTLLTAKKWVVLRGKVGILYEFSGVATAIVHMVGETGETLGVVECGINDLTIARLMDIPESRRPDSVRGAGLGYI